MKEASECLKLTAQDLLEMKVIEKIISENGKNFHRTYVELKQSLYETLVKNSGLDAGELVEKRYARFRRIGPEYK